MAWLRNLARGLVRDADTAEEVVQDTWIAALQNRPRDLEGGRLRAWLASVARNVARRRHRDEAVRRKYEQEAMEAVDDSSPDEVERLRLQRLVADEVLSLREPYRTAVLLRYQRGFSYARIAASEDIRQETARQRVSRGLAALRKQLDARFEDDRRAWCLALAPLAERGGLAPVGSTLALGGFTMGTKTVVVAAVVVLSAAGLYLIPRSGIEPTAAAPAVADIDIEHTGPQVDSSSPAIEQPDSQRSVVTASPEVREVGALATADPERDLHGRVIDQDGEPVPGARITIRRDDIREFSQLDVGRDKSGVSVVELESDAFGEFAIPLDIGRPFFMFVEREGFARAIRQDRYAGEFLEVQLSRGATFAGRVVRAGDGTGIPSRIEGRRRKVGFFELFNASTAADGSFRFEGLEAGELTVEVHPQGAASPTWFNTQLRAGETLEHEFVCEEGFVVRGRVTDARTGAPIVGAEVSEGWTFDRFVSTDAGGEYVIEHFQTSGVYDVVVRAAGYGRQEKDLSEGVDGVVTLDFQLDPGRRAVGRIVDPHGEPVPDAYVVAAAYEWEAASGKTDWKPARSAADGSFEIVDLRMDVRHALYVVREGFATVTYDFPEDEKALTTIELGTLALQRPFVLRGVVVGSNDEPLPNCMLQLTGINDDRGLLGGSPVEGVEAYCGKRSGRTDHLGRFSFADLAPAEYKLGVRPPDARWHYETHRVGNAGRVQKVRIELQTGLTIAGQVFNPEGEPLPEVLVMIEPMEGTPGEGGHSKTDSDGRFSVAGLSPGRFRLDAYPMETDQEERAAMLSTVMEVSSGSEALEVHLRTATTITGEVFDAEGRAVLNATVRALDPEGTIKALTRTEADGSFSLSLESGEAVDLIATPPPDNAPFYDFNQVDAGLAFRLEGVSAGSTGLILNLPKPQQGPR